ncbi:pentapeptide repeat-containing protein [Kordiimonas aquimaris]|uniref:pentapeptide repeat-containing protein n=1 Tax=Kordiimonas aquimaris TaxID=707591 RepID=UPI0021D2CB06|nr:pentapeptide repeat-containing protein [Kordiimonas aquimaris]
MANNKSNLPDWFPVDIPQEWQGRISAILLLTFLLIAVGVLFKFLAVLVGGETHDNPSEALRNYALILAALIGVPFLVWRSIVAQKQVDVAEQGQITDRINKAVQGLGAEKVVRQLEETPRYKKRGDEWLRDEEGNLIPAIRPDGKAFIDRETFELTQPNLEVRVGAIYALERLAQDSLRDHIQIMEILCAYIRENAPQKTLKPTEDLHERPSLRADIQAAIRVIGRRSQDQVDVEWKREFRLDIRKANLSGGDFVGGNFSAAMFHDCLLEACWFREARLHGTQFFRSIINHSDFWGAELTGTDFYGAISNRPKPILGGFHCSIGMGKVYGVSLTGADLSAETYLGDGHNSNLNFGTRDTILARGCKPETAIEEKYLGFHETRKLRESGNHDEADEKEEGLYATPFADWFPYDSTDMMMSSARLRFLKRLSLDCWPYK